MCVYYKEIKRELKRMHMYGCRFNERLKLRLRDLNASHALLRGGRGHLKIETMLKGERFESVRGECAT